jgi:hypothetical protein
MLYEVWPISRTTSFSIPEGVSTVWYAKGCVMVPVTYWIPKRAIAWCCKCERDVTYAIEKCYWWMNYSTRTQGHCLMHSEGGGFSGRKGACCERILLRCLCPLSCAPKKLYYKIEYVLYSRVNILLK